MSERIGQSVDDTKGNKSSWMAHWMPTLETHSHSGNDSLANGLLEVPRSVTGFGFIKTKNIESIRPSSKNLGIEGKCTSLFKLDLEAHNNNNNMQPLNPMFGHNLDRGKATEIEYPSVAFGIPAANGGAGTTSMNPLEWLKKHSSAKDNSIVALKPLQKTFAELSSQMVPQRLDWEKYDFEKGKSTTFSVNQLPNANLRMLNFGPLADLLRERKMDSHSQSDNPMNACFKEINRTLLFGVPSTSNHYLPQVEQEWFQKTHKCSSIRMFPNQCISDRTKSKISHSDHYSLQKMPKCVHEMETMRICTTVDAVEGMPGGCPTFSQTTQSLLIRQKIGVNLSKENDIFKSTEVLSKIDENTSSDLPNLSPILGQGNQEMKAQNLCSSFESEGKGNDRDVKAFKVTMKNESSAETDTMDMDFLKEKNLHTVGTDSTAPTKEFNTESNLPPKVDVATSENMCRSFSKTQSLDMDTLLVNTEQPKLNLNLSLENSIEAEDPSYRWVKRLKLSTSKTPSLGSKSSYLDENLPHEKMSNIYGKIIKNNITTPEPNPSKSGDLSKEDEDILVEPLKKDKELLFSHAWIKRWMSNESKTSQEKTQKVCEPQSSILVVEDLEKKQFPSIAAMALMGKAMNGFQQCELQKKGSFTVWNTKAF